MAENATSSYIDIEKLTAPEFSAYAHANSLVLSTNNASDPSIDLTTPLSRALFDLQEIDSNIHSLTSRSAIDILTYSSKQNQSAGRILARVEDERSRLNTSYQRLEKEILGQYNKAQEVKLHAERSHELLKLGRNVQRILNLARQFEALLADSGLAAPQNATPTARAATVKEDHRVLVRATSVILTFRELIARKDLADVTKVNLVRTIRGRVFEDGEARVLDYARRVVREFAISSLTSSTGSTFKEAEDSKSKFGSAVQILYLLSPAPQLNDLKMKKQDFEPEYLIRALQGYLQTAVTSSSAGIARALTQLPTLDRALLEVSARCQNIVGLEALLRSIAPPIHPFLSYPKSNEASNGIDRDELEGESSDEEDELDELQQDNLLTVLLESLDTSSLPSYFWRSLASQLSSRVQETINRGGFVARTLKATSGDIRTQIRECVFRGSRMPSGIVKSGSGKAGQQEQMVENWEREAAVMVSSVMGPLSR